MNKSELVTAVASGTDLTKKETETIVDLVIANISETLAKGEDVKLVGFGNFTVKATAAREARNPRTGETFPVAAGRKISFKPAKALKDSVSL